MDRKIFQLVVALTAAIFAVGQAHAEFSEPQNWNRADTNSTFQQWDLFTGFTNQLADGDAFNPNGTASLSVTNDTSIYALTGNIYAPGGIAQFGINVPDYGLGDGFLTTVNLQIRTQGTEMLTSSLQLNYNAGGDSHIASPVNQQIILSQPLGGPGGVLVERWFTFHIPTSPDMFDVTFQALGPHMSLDALVIDTITTTETEGYLTAAVPEPTTLGLLGFAGTLMLVRRRRADQSVG